MVYDVVEIALGDIGDRPWIDEALLEPPADSEPTTTATNGGEN